MMQQPKIAILCGGKSAFQSIQILALEKYLCGIAIATSDSDLSQLLGKEASQIGIPFTSISTKNELDQLEEWLDEAHPDAVFSIGFPYRIPASILEMLPGKFINFHHGPLPQYRGAMPIFEVLRAGENETAISVHLMDAEFDEGPVIFQEPIPIDEHETFGSLALKVADRTSLAVQNTAQMLRFGDKLPAFPQNEEEAGYFPQPEDEDTLINWPYMEAGEIVALVNACNPWNGGADTFILQRPVKIVSASINAETQTEAQPGTILQLEPNEPLQVACINGEVVNIHIVSNDHGVLPAHFLLQQHILKGHLFKQ